MKLKALDTSLKLIPIYPTEAELQRKTSELKVSCNYETDGVLIGKPSLVCPLIRT